MLCATFLQFLKGMSEKIKQGIEAAQTDLVKEKALKEQEEVREEGREGEEGGREGGGRELARWVGKRLVKGAR